MIGLFLELRKSRMRWWGMLAASCSIVIALLNRERWFDSLAEASIWCVVPVMYVGSVIVAGAADGQRVWRSTSLGLLMEMSARAHWQATLDRLVVVVLYGAVLPVVLPAIVVIGLAQFGARHGIFDFSYLWLTILFLLAACALGLTVGTLSRSRPAAVILGATFGIAFSLFGNPIPATVSAWNAPNSVRILVLGAVTVLLLGGFWLASTDRRKGRFPPFRAIGAVSAVLGLIVTYLFTGVPKTDLRVRSDAGVCRQDEGFTVCVWPGNEYHLGDLTAMGKKSVEMSKYLGSSTSWTIAEQGLTVPQSTAVVAPPGTGDGMWLTAEELAFVVMNERFDALNQCDYAALSESRLEALQLRNWALAEVMTDFVYGGPRPQTIKGSDQELDSYVLKSADDVISLPHDDQLKWIEKVLREVATC